MNNASDNGRGGPSPAPSNVAGCPPVRRADTQVGPYTRSTIQKQRRRLKWLALLVLLVGWAGMAQAQQPNKIARVGSIWELGFFFSDCHKVIS